MPFGYFYVTEKPGNRNRKGKSAPPVPPETLTIRVDVVARNLSLISELMCSMYQNMNASLPQHGMAFYAPELDTIENVVAMKKRYETYFRNFSQADWRYDEDREQSAKREYRFCLSPSGNQKKAIEMTFRCKTSFDADFSRESADAVWLIADGVCLSEAGAEDEYAQSLPQALNRMETQWEGEAACLILTQFENRGLLDALQGSDSLRGALFSVARERFGDGNGKVKMMPAQLYGGLDYSGTDEHHAPVLQLGKSLQVYRPFHCHIPALYTLRTFSIERGADFFADVMEGGLFGGVAGLFEDAFSNPAWTPETLRGNPS